VEPASEFAFDAFDVVPDLITIRQGRQLGYVPVGGVIISGDIAKTFDDRVFPGGLHLFGPPARRRQYRRGNQRNGGGRGHGKCSFASEPTF